MPLGRGIALHLQQRIFEVGWLLAAGISMGCVTLPLSLSPRKASVGMAVSGHGWPSRSAALSAGLMGASAAVQKIQ